MVNQFSRNEKINSIFIENLAQFRETLNELPANSFCVSMKNDSILIHTQITDFPHSLRFLPPSQQNVPEFMFEPQKLIEDLEWATFTQIPHEDLERAPSSQSSSVVLYEFGSYREHPCFIVDCSNLNEIPLSASSYWKYIPLRSLFNQAPDEVVLLMGIFQQLLRWIQTTRFCGRCGEIMEFSPTEFARLCTHCGHTIYPTISPAVIVGVRKGNTILLAHNYRFPPHLYSIIAGFCDIGENLEETVVRELREEVGIEVTNLRYFGSQPWPFPNSLMLGFIADWRANLITVDGVEIQDAHWFTLEELPDIPMTISIARKIIDALRYDIETRPQN